MDSKLWRMQTSLDQIKKEKIIEIMVLIAIWMWIRFTFGKSKCNRHTRYWYTISRNCLWTKKLYNIIYRNPAGMSKLSIFILLKCCVDMLCALLNRDMRPPHPEKKKKTFFWAVLWNEKSLERIYKNNWVFISLFFFSFPLTREIFKV